MQEIVFQAEEVESMLNKLQPTQFLSGGLSCPHCGIPMGSAKRCILKVAPPDSAERSWHVCSLPCGVAMHKKMFPNARGTVATIDTFTPPPERKEPETFDFGTVYDR